MKTLAFDRSSTLCPVAPNAMTSGPLIDGKLSMVRGLFWRLQVTSAHDGQARKRLQSKAGYLDARPHIPQLGGQTRPRQSRPHLHPGPLCPERWGNRPSSLWIAEDLGCCASG